MVDNRLVSPLTGIVPKSKWPFCGIVLVGVTIFLLTGMILQVHPTISRATPRKTNNPPLEDIFPIKNGDFRFSHVSFFGGVIFHLVMLVFWWCNIFVQMGASSTTDSTKSVWVVWVSLLWWLVGVFLQHPNLELKLLYQTLIGNKVAVLF